ncbi:hypothetical protein FRB90_005037 [Tulasnella sp. 427]|nr:hypothetical protein FRB90_005037 [Tulasnella sp. 427]
MGGFTIQRTLPGGIYVPLQLEDAEEILGAPASPPEQEELVDDEHAETPDLSQAPENPSESTGSAHATEEQTATPTSTEQEPSETTTQSPDITSAEFIAPNDIDSQPPHSSHSDVEGPPTQAQAPVPLTWYLANRSLMRILIAVMNAYPVLADRNPYRDFIQAPWDVLVHSIDWKLARAISSALRLDLAVAWKRGLLHKRVWGDIRKAIRAEWESFGFGPMGSHNQAAT